MSENESLPTVGKYWARIVGATTTEQEGKAPNIRVECVADFLSTPDGGYENITPIEFPMYWYMSQKAWDMTVKKLSIIGFNGDFENPSFTPKDPEKPYYEVRCKHETYEGKTRAKWDLASWGSEQKKIDSVSAAKLNARYKATVGEEAATPQVPPAPPAEPSAAGVPDAVCADTNGEEIPF